MSSAARVRRHRARDVHLDEAPRDSPPAWRSSIRGLHRLLLNKYYVDELYDATIVQPIKVVSTEGLWRGVRRQASIDGAVNGAGSIVERREPRAAPAADRVGQDLRGSMFVGVVLILGYYLWR